MSQTRHATTDIADLLTIMRELRDPDTGCPWDVEQDFASIAPYTIEEAYETADAIERGDLYDLKDELGDLLLQVVFHARMAEEQSLFSFGDVVETVSAKMIRRHPHVYGTAGKRSTDAVLDAWTEIKAAEKDTRRKERQALGLPVDEKSGALAGVPVGLPSMTRAFKLQEKASRTGFDWNDARLVLAKIREECDEVERELDNQDDEKTGAEIGDLLFAVVNLARHARVDPETALRKTNRKFENRFEFIEAELKKRGQSTSDASLAEMDALWDAAKVSETAENEPAGNAGKRN